MTTLLRVDPGVAGGVAVLDGDEVLLVTDLPRNPCAPNWTFTAFMGCWRSTRLYAHAFIEKVNSRARVRRRASLGRTCRGAQPA